MNKLIFFSVSLSILSTSCGASSMELSSHVKEAWNRANDPLRLGGRYSRNFASLPLEGSIDKADRPWSDSYWPSIDGGIAARWSGQIERGFDTKLATLEDVKKMTPDQLRAMSPAEKYDVYMGRFDYPTVQRERMRTSPDDAGWEGLCHGWAAASLLYREPAAAVVVSSDGVEVPFGASDIKALLIYFQAEIANARSNMLGERCNRDSVTPEDMGASDCRDTNAGSLQIVLANRLGLQKKGFVIDRTRNFQVWNQPVFAFKSTVEKTQGPSEGAAIGTVQEVVLATQVSYAVEIEPRWDKVLDTEDQNDSAETYHYRLELDASGEIIGGEWLEWNRPDFLWTQERENFTGYFRGLQEILKAAGN